MAFGRWLVGGLIGALVGAAVWVAIGYFANAEVGIVAWGIGLVVGLGVRAGAATDGQEPSVSQGILAAALALLTILGAKYVVIDMLVDNAMGDGIDAIAVDTEIQEEDMVLSNVYDILDEKEEAGEKVLWPTGQSIETAEAKADFPPKIWQRAQKDWNANSAEEKEGLMEERRTQMKELANLFGGGLAGNIKKEAFMDSFTPYDLLWFGLAIYTAFNVGYGSEDE